MDLNIWSTIFQNDQCIYIKSKLEFHKYTKVYARYDGQSIDYRMTDIVAYCQGVSEPQ